MRTSLSGRRRFEQTNTPANLLLACDKNTGDLNTTKLTWVVGSAIRGSTEPDAQSVATLLGQMGVSKALAQAAADRCPGLGQTLSGPSTWNAMAG